ncbi:hypothetical protein ACLB2K_021688 [Fragaria x ananassa]
MITLLCIKSNVPFHGDDALALPVNPVDRVAIAKLAAQSGLYVESLEQTLLKKEIKMWTRQCKRLWLDFRTMLNVSSTTSRRKCPGYGSLNATGMRFLVLPLLLLRILPASSDPGNKESDDVVIRRVTNDDEDASA